MSVLIENQKTVAWRPYLLVKVGHADVITQLQDILGTTSLVLPLKPSTSRQETDLSFRNEDGTGQHSSNRSLSSAPSRRELRLKLYFGDYESLSSADRPCLSQDELEELREKGRFTSVFRFKSSGVIVSSRYELVALSFNVVCAPVACS